MKKIISVILIVVMCFSLVACADSKVINDKEYKTYGLFNKEQYYDDNISYSLSYGNVIWGIVLFETVIAPVYFFGFSLYEPECFKNIEE